MAVSSGENFGNHQGNSEKHKNSIWILSWRHVHRAFRYGCFSVRECVNHSCGLPVTLDPGSRSPTCRRHLDGSLREYCSSLKQRNGLGVEGTQKGPKISYGFATLPCSMGKRGQEISLISTVCMHTSDSIPALSLARPSQRSEPEVNVRSQRHTSWNGPQLIRTEDVLSERFRSSFIEKSALLSMLSALKEKVFPNIAFLQSFVHHSSSFKNSQSMSLYQAHTTDYWWSDSRWLTVSFRQKLKAVTFLKV